MVTAPAVALLAAPAAGPELAASPVRRVIGHPMAPQNLDGLNPKVEICELGQS